LAEAGIEPSVGSKGDSYDNALAAEVRHLFPKFLISAALQINDFKDLRCF